MNTEGLLPSMHRVRQVIGGPARSQPTTPLEEYKSALPSEKHQIQTPCEVYRFLDDGN